VTRNGKQQISGEVLEKEVEYTIQWIKKAPNNESPWAYIKGLFRGKKYSNYPKLVQLFVEFRDKYITSSHVHSLLLDIYEEQSTKESLQKAVEFCTMLEVNLDNLHRKFWNYRRSKVQEMLSKV